MTLFCFDHAHLQLQRLVVDAELVKGSEYFVFIKMQLHQPPLCRPLGHPHKSHILGHGECVRGDGRLQRVVQIVAFAVEILDVTNQIISYPVQGVAPVIYIARFTAGAKTTAVRFIVQ